MDARKADVAGEDFLHRGRGRELGSSGDLCHPPARLVAVAMKSARERGADLAGAARDDELHALAAAILLEYATPMSIELPSSVEEQLRDLATKQGRDIDSLVVEAIREYLEAAAITDLEPAEVAQAQIALVSELQGVSEWKGGE